MSVPPPESGLSLPLVITVTWTAFHAFMYGYHVSALNGIQQAMTCPDLEASQALTTVGSIASNALPSGCIEMTTYQFGYVTSIFTIGGLLGALSTGSIANARGCKTVLRASEVLVFGGSSMLVLAQSMVGLLVGRFIIGLGCGLGTVGVPLVLSRISPPSLKSRVGLLTQLFIVIGVFVSQSLSFPFSHLGRWRNVLIVSCTITGMLFLVSFTMGVGDEHRGDMKPATTEPEEESQALLPPDLDLPTDTRRDTVSNVKSRGIPEVLREGREVVRRGLIIVVITQMAQQLCGISPVMYYSTEIMSTVFPTNANLVALAITASKIPLTFMPMLLIQRYGSQQLLVTSAASMTVFAALLGLAINAGWAWVSSIAIIALVAAYSLGLGPVVWVVIAEVLPPDVVGAGGSIGTTLNWSTAFIMSVVFLPLRDLLAAAFPIGEGTGNIFFLFSLFSAAAAIAIHHGFARLKELS